MRNFILAVTSFIATVILLSQVALANDEGWDPKHTTAAQGEEPIINLNAGRSNGDPKNVEGSSPDSGENNQNPCTTCKNYRAPVQALNRKSTLPKPSTPGATDSGGSGGQKGTK